VATTAVVAAQSQAPGSSEGPPTGPSITVVAEDHRYDGLPTSLPVGSHLRLSNSGTEVHQMIVARRVDGVTETWDELLADPDPVGAGLIELAGQLFAAPGQDAAGDITIPRAGEYFAVCFVPVGVTSIPNADATPVPQPSSAEPALRHYMLGMRQEFAVTEPGSTPGPLPAATEAPASASAASVPASASTAAAAPSPAP
jgi:hypothetical protein